MKRKNNMKRKLKIAFYAISGIFFLGAAWLMFWIVADIYQMLPNYSEDYSVAVMAVVFYTLLLNTLAIKKLSYEYYRTRQNKKGTTDWFFCIYLVGMMLLPLCSDGLLLYFSAPIVAGILMLIYYVFSLITMIGAAITSLLQIIRLRKNSEGL